jgi:hypothetical protein
MPVLGFLPKTNPGVLAARISYAESRRLTVPL